MIKLGGGCMFIYKAVSEEKIFFPKQSYFPTYTSLSFFFANYSAF